MRLNLPKQVRVYSSTLYKGIVLHSSPSGNVLFTLRNKGIKLRCIDLPELNTLTLGIFGSVAQWERELISNRTKRGLRELAKTRKLGTPSNLTIEAKKKGVESIIRNRIENENWKLAKTFIKHFQMKNGYTSLTEISNELNINGYRTRRGCSFSPEIVKRLIGS